MLLTRICRHVVVITIAAHCLLDCATAQAQAERAQTSNAAISSLDDVTAETIFASWRKRAELCPSARLSLTVRADEVMWPASTLDGNSARTTRVRPQRKEYEYTYDLSIDSPRVRYELSGDRIMLDDGSLGPADMAGAFDGSLSTMLADPSVNVEFHSGHVFRLTTAEGFVTSTNYPVRWTFAPLAEPLHEFSLRAFQLSPKRQVKDGTTCLVLVQDDTNGFWRSLWIDPARDFSIVRYTIATKERLVRQLDCEYERNDVGAWLPTRWTTVRRDSSDGSPSSTETVTVDRCEVAPEFRKDEFVISFPPGTVVEDARPDPAFGGVSRAGTVSYVQLDNNQKMALPLQRDGRSVSRQELLDVIRAIRSQQQ